MRSTVRSKANNGKPFEYHTQSGIIFRCDRSDLSCGIKVIGAPMHTNSDWNFTQLLTDVAEMIAYHRGEVWPTLNGFAGYGCIRFEEAEQDGTEGQDRDNYTDDQDRDNYTKPENSLASVSKKAYDLQTGDIIILWRDCHKVPATVKGYIDDNGSKKVTYEVYGSTARYSAMFDASQNINVFKNMDDAKVDASL